MKTSLQCCTEAFFRHAYAARRRNCRDKVTVQSLCVMAHVESGRVGRAALAVLREIRMDPAPRNGAA